MSEPITAPGPRANREGLLIGVAGAVATAIALVALLLLVLGLPLWFQYLQGPCPFPCQDERLTVSQWMRAHQVGISPSTYAAVFVVLRVGLAAACFGVAGLVIWRKPRERMAWLVAAVLALVGGTFSGADELARGTLPGLGPTAAMLNGARFLLFPLLAYLFPNGHFTPRWMRWMMVSSVAAYLLFQTPYAARLTPYAWFIVALWALPPVFSQIYRYRRVSAPIERQQVKWVVYGLVIAGATFLMVTGADAILGMEGFVAPAQKLLVEGLFYLGMVLIPVTFGVAILRYRLFDIDVIIRRTIQYAVVVALLMLTYAGLIIILQNTVLAASPRGDSLAVVLSTLAIAALFNPLRYRVQKWVDRRFYRSAHDSEALVAAFGRMALNEGDLALLTDEMMTTIHQTMQPTFAGLWLAQPQARKAEEDEF